MAGATNNHLYDQIVDATREYLGPAADRFIARQVANHLHKSPEELQATDLRQLIDWLKLSMAFLTNDEKLITRYVEELKAISKAERSVTRGKSKNRHN